MSSKTTKGLVQRSAEGVLTQVTSFVLQMVLARILMPEDFGVVAILSTFINIANTLVNNGLSSALIQKKDAGQADICTVFYIDFTIGVLMYLVIFLTAPLIAVFYENAMITAYLRVFAISLFLTPLSSIQLTVARRHMNFTPSLLANGAAVAVQAIVGITMALNGGGVWSLVVSQLANYAVQTILLLILVRWRPTWEFSVSSFKSMFAYSWKLFAGWMIGTLYQDVFSWIIGKKYDATTLGYYSKGNSIPSIVNRVVTQVTTAVMFPAIAKNQDDHALVKQQTRQILSISAAMVFPVMAGLAGAADSLVRVVLTEKWLGCVAVIQIMCIPMTLNIISNANMQSFNAVGRSDIFLRMEIIKRGSTLLLVFICMNINYYLMLFSIGFGGIVSLVMNAVYNKKLFGYGYREYLADLMPYAICAMALFAVVYFMNWLPVNVFVKLLLQLLVCGVVYLGYIFSGVLPAYKGVRQTLLSLLKKKAKA